MAVRTSSRWPRGRRTAWRAAAPASRAAAETRRKAPPQAIGEALRVARLGGEGCPEGVACLGAGAVRVPPPG